MMEPEPSNELGVPDTRHIPRDEPRETDFPAMGRREFFNLCAWRAVQIGGGLFLVAGGARSVAMAMANCTLAPNTCGPSAPPNVCNAQGTVNTCGEAMNICNASQGGGNQCTSFQATGNTCKAGVQTNICKGTVGSNVCDSALDRPGNQCSGTNICDPGSANTCKGGARGNVCSGENYCYGSNACNGFNTCSGKNTTVPVD